jgi:hypothetical protein
MLILSEQEENAIQLTDFDIELAIDKLKEGFAVAPFWRDRIYAKLQNNLQNFFHERNRFDRERKN